MNNAVSCVSADSSSIAWKYYDVSGSRPLGKRDRWGFWERLAFCTECGSAVRSRRMVTVVGESDSAGGGDQGGEGGIGAA